MTKRTAFVVLGVVVMVIGFAIIATRTAAESAPSCATHQDGMSMNEQNACLDKVGTWCTKHHPNDLTCMNRVFGYVPGGVN